MRRSSMSKRSAVAVAPWNGADTARAMTLTRSDQQLYRWFHMALIGLLLLTTFYSAQAATFTVTSTSDSGPGSLRQAIADSKSGDIINVDAGQTITSAGFILDHDLNINGPHPGWNDSLGWQTIAVNGHVTLLTVKAGCNVHVTDLSFSGGSPSVDNAGTLTLTRCEVKDASRQAQFEEVAKGGGISNSGTLTLEKCYIHDNSLVGYTSFDADALGETQGAGIYNGGTLTANNTTISNCLISDGAITFGGGGGLYNAGTATLNNCTIYGNKAMTHGGSGAGGAAALNMGTLNLNSCTVAYNWSDYFDGGIVSNGGTVTVMNSIIAYNSSSNNLPSVFTDFRGSLNSLDYNVVTNASDAVITGVVTHNIYAPATNPFTAQSLGANADAPPTLRLNVYGPAIDAGKVPSGITSGTDQKGTARPSDFGNIPNAGDGSDIGASEEPAPPAPIISSFTPTAGISSTSVQIDGSNFDNVLNVRFNGQDAQFTGAGPTSLSAVVPSGATTGKISVITLSGIAQSTADFIVIPQPTITSFTPASGSVGMTVTINGTALTNATTAKPTVKFNTTVAAAASVTVVSSTQIKALVPSGATTGKITVDTTGGSAATASNFTVVPKPTITSFTPASGSVGMSITVNGTNFTNATTTKPTVKFNTTLVTAANVTVVSASQIKALVPAGATTGKITVETTGGPALTGSSFTVVPKPTISSFTPTSGSIGMTVTINGTGLVNSTTAKPTVKFGTLLAAVSSATATVVKVVVPLNAITGKISLTTTGGTATTVSNFTIVPKPTLTSFTPLSGSVGATVTINGTNLINATTAKPTVLFGSLASPTVTVVSAAQVKAVVPANALTGKITVTTSGGTVVSAGTFTLVPKPVITSFTPASGAVGMTVSIAGTGLINATTPTPKVLFGTLAATVTYASATLVKVLVPANALTSKITITTTGGTVISANAFTVVPKPVITGFTPASGAVGSEITIAGTGLTNTTTAKPTVLFGSVTATVVTVVSSTSIKAIVPAGAITAKITITTTGGTVLSGTSFTVVPKPTITSFTPTSGSIGMEVTINGTNFTNATTTKPTVKFGGVLASVVTVVSASQLKAIVPSGAVTGGITVTTTGGSASTISGFTVVPRPTITGIAPNTGAIGRNVTITGTNFTNATSITPTVKFGAISATVVTVVSSTQLIATLPAGSAPGQVFVSVVNSGGTALGPLFTVVPAPVITSFTPSTGAVGSTVTINGSNFTNATTTRPAVAIGAVQCSTVTVLSSSQIQVVVPVASGRITVTTTGGSYTTTAIFTAFLPGLVGHDSAPEASSLTLSGGSARAATGTIDLYFSGPLDVDSAIDAAHYSLEVSGVAATIESASYSNGKLTLGLAAGALHRGDTVVVRWNNLLDSRGRMLNGSSGTLTAG